MVDIEIKCDVTGLGTCCGCFCRMLKKKKEKRLLAWPLTGRYFQSADLTGFCVSRTPKIHHRALDVHPHLVIIKALSDGTKDSATVLFPLEDLWGVRPYPALRLRWIIIFYFILFFGFYVFSDTVGNHKIIIIKKKTNLSFQFWTVLSVASGHFALVLVIDQIWRWAESLLSHPLVLKNKRSEPL